MICVENAENALILVLFQPLQVNLSVLDENRDVRYDASKCEKYFEIMEDAGKIPVCGLCIYNCPKGIRKTE